MKKGFQSIAVVEVAYIRRRLSKENVTVVLIVNRKVSSLRQGRMVERDTTALVNYVKLSIKLCRYKLLFCVYNILSDSRSTSSYRVGVF